MKTIGFVAGTFDLLNLGHIYLLRECKKYCDELIVGLHIDPSKERKEKNKPIESLVERGYKLRSCVYVDKIMPYETESDLELLFFYLKPDIRFLGSDYVDNKKHITGKSLIPIKYIKSLGIHTSDIRRRVKKAK